MAGKTAARWPLLIIALPASVAIWSGWVGLGQLCGFGPVQLLPGITGWTLNTAITLPIGAEAYAVYAVHAYISPGTPQRARRFAFWSSVGAGLYGITGQVTFHLLDAAGRAAAPWPVVVFVSCMPVAVVMLAAVLTHLLNGEEEKRKEDVPGPAPEPVPAVSAPVSLPGPREIQRRQQCSPTTAKKIRSELERYRRGLGGMVPAPGAVGEAPAVVPPATAGALPSMNGSHG